MNEWIESATRQARAVLAKFGPVPLPVPVEMIARKRGITVRHLPLDDELSGMSFIKNGVAVIVVNISHHSNRQRFTVAHELGHHVLHQTYLQNNVHIDKVVLHRNQHSSGGTEQKEVEANAFAAELLMPLSKVRIYRDIDINNESELLKIARVFKVSPTAMAFRIINVS